MAPDKIYINGFSAFATEPVKDGTEYIRKEALVKWAKKCMASIARTQRERKVYSQDLATKDVMFCLFIDKLNSM